MEKRTARGLLYGPRDIRTAPKLPAHKVKEENFEDFLDYVENYSIKAQQFLKWFDYGFLDDPKLEWVELTWAEDGIREVLLVDDAIREVEPEVTEWRIAGEYLVDGRYKQQCEGHTIRELYELHSDSKLFKLLMRSKPFEAPWVTKG